MARKMQWLPVDGQRNQQVLQRLFHPLSYYEYAIGHTIGEQELRNYCCVGSGCSSHGIAAGARLC